jgi:hypothetical protein
MAETPVTPISFTGKQDEAYVDGLHTTKAKLFVAK